MNNAVPAMLKAAERVLVDIEQAVARFPRAHRYTCGADLRNQAMHVARLAHRYWRDHEHRGEWIRKLTWALDDLKLTLQLGSRIKAFASFAQFESLSRTVADLGRQVGGLFKHHHPKGQNAGARSAPPQCAKTLSTQAASRHEAHP
jgi:hypothetical protein